MALSTATLQAAIEAELATTFPTGSIAGYDGGAWRTAFANAIAKAVVEHIKSYADVVLSGGELTVTTVVGPGVVDPGTVTGGVN